MTPRMRAAIWIATGAAAVAIVVFGSSRNDGGGDPPEPGPVIVVPRDDRSFPAGCRARRVAARLLWFFDAFNRGDSARLRQVFAEASRSDLDTGFRWYSVAYGNPAATGHQEYVTSDPAALGDYFEARHRQRERLSLVALAVGLRGNTGQIEYYLRRQAADFERAGIRTTLAEGKGAIDCSSQKIYVWSMGMSESDSLGPARALCPDVPRPPNDRVVACAR